MLHLTLRELAAKKLRLLTTAIAVMLGVAFMAGTMVLTATISKTFDGLFADGYAGTDAYVRGSGRASTPRSSTRSSMSTVSPQPRARSVATPNWWTVRVNPSVTRVRAPRRSARHG